MSEKEAKKERYEKVLHFLNKDYSWVEDVVEDIKENPEDMLCDGRTDLLQKCYNRLCEKHCLSSLPSNFDWDCVEDLKAVKKHVLGKCEIDNDITVLLFIAMVDAKIIALGEGPNTVSDLWRNELEEEQAWREKEEKGEDENPSDKIEGQILWNIVMRGPEDLSDYIGSMESLPDMTSEKIGFVLSKLYKYLNPPASFGPSPPTPTEHVIDWDSIEDIKMAKNVIEEFGEPDKPIMQDCFLDLADLRIEALEENQEEKNDTYESSFQKMLMTKMHERIWKEMEELEGELLEDFFDDMTNAGREEKAGKSMEQLAKEAYDELPDNLGLPYDFFEEDFNDEEKYEVLSYFADQMMPKSYTEHIKECFPPDQLVQMANGDVKPIENIEPEEKIVSICVGYEDEEENQGKDELKEMLDDMTNEELEEIMKDGISVDQTCINMVAEEMAKEASEGKDVSYYLKYNEDTDSYYHCIVTFPQNDEENEDYDSTEDTKEHQNKVKELLGDFRNRLRERGDLHDTSKLHSPEKEVFDWATPKLEDMTYGSEEYEDVKEKMEGALEHHYARNRHHPEHFKFGVLGMNLLDLVEMFADWCAATKRHKDGDIFRSIEKNAERFNLSDDLVQILKHTAQNLSWGEKQD